MYAGDRVELVCDIGARFTEDAQTGFDAVRVFTPAEGVLRGLEMGTPWQDATPDSVVAEAGGFVVYLPQPIQRDGVKRLRLRLETALYNAAGEIVAEVFARGQADFPQLVVAGDVSEEMGTNQLRIVATAQGSVLAAMKVEPNAFTPQGDAVNDEVRIGYTLLKVLDASEVSVEVFDLRGRCLWRAGPSGREAGRHAVLWDGRDQSGRLVGPGLYLVRVEVETDRQREERMACVAVVY